MKEKTAFNITLLRHGESVGNAEGYFQGQSDFPLTERGRAQARSLAARWKREKKEFDYIIASPLVRAHETAEIIAEALKHPIDETNPLWMERDNGKVTGMRHEEGRRYLNETLSEYNPYKIFAEEGEGDWALYLRAGSALQNLLERPPARYLIVSHGAILNHTMKSIVGAVPHANYQGAQFRFRNTAFATLTYLPRAHRWHIEGVNDREHWSEDA